MNVLLKSKSTGLIGSYPASHAELSDDLVPVDSEGNVCLPCMGVSKTEEDKPVVETTTNSKEKK